MDENDITGATKGVGLLQLLLIWVLVLAASAVSSHLIARHALHRESTDE